MALYIVLLAGLSIIALYTAFKTKTVRKRKIMLLIGVATTVLLPFYIGILTGFAFIILYDDGFAGIGGAYIGWLSCSVTGIMMILAGLFMDKRNNRLFKETEPYI
ncbi:hypothetical protein [Bacillus testis]|uniref:hypothetical protein n=1 Tax=Bacillus testis TaxID=1622072 RepID=UPI00067F64D7|nr:hypothetical protein [Bacillus testis]